MLDFSISYLVNSNVLNFVVFVAIIAVVAYKFDISSLLENFRKKIEDSVKQSEKNKVDAETLLNKAKLEDAKTPQEIAFIQENSQNTLKSLQEKILTDANAQISHIEQNVNKIVDSEKNKISSALAKGLSKASVELAEHNIVKKLENNIDLHNKFIVQAIDELEEVGL